VLPLQFELADFLADACNGDNDLVQSVPVLLQLLPLPLLLDLEVLDVNCVVLELFA
jgi:hypothetical protein